MARAIMSTPITLEYARRSRRRRTPSNLLYASSLFSAVALLALARYRYTVVMAIGGWCGTTREAAESTMHMAVAIAWLFTIVGLAMAFVGGGRWKQIRPYLFLAVLNVLCFMMPQIWAIRDQMFPHY